MDPDSDLDPESDPAIFVTDLQDASKKLILNTIFSACYFLMVHLQYIIFQRLKVKKSRRIVGFKIFLIIFTL